MATYKVIQDIEAEDKLLGPLTLRQFIYACIVVVLGFIAFKLGQATWFLALPFVPPMAFFALLAAPFGTAQSNEVWLLAKIRFFLKPQRRIWDQSGLKELVTITVPKRIERQLTKSFNQEEARSRLQALASTIDSRGWAVKNVSVNLFSQPSYVLNQADSDRLIDPGTIAQEVPSYGVSGSDDMMDERSNLTAQHIDQMVAASSQSHRQQVIQQMQQGGSPGHGAKAQTDDYWFMHQPDPGSVPKGYATFPVAPTVKPGATDNQSPAATAKPTPDETAVMEHILAEKAKPESSYHHLKTLQPLSAKKPLADKSNDRPLPNVPAPASTSTTGPSDPDILNLAKSNDLNVDVLGREAKRARKEPPDEVVFSIQH